jgi:purine-nucleoside phosphorylase
MVFRPPAKHREQLETAARAVREIADAAPRFGVILGSGLGAFADTFTDAVRIPYDEIPFWPTSTVEGHSGQLVVGTHAGTEVAVMQGRVHLYEGYEPWEVVFPVRVLSLIGCRGLVVSNAAGAINRAFSAGELMLIVDHLNLQGTNACLGDNLDALGPRFFDMSYAYDPGYRELARAAAARLDIELREGVYAALLGPSYETPAEIRMLERMGADAVGMSTVPEVTAANHAGMKVVGITCLSNMAAGVLDTPLDHAEVMETGERIRDAFIGLIGELISELARASRDPSA